MLGANSGMIVGLPIFPFNGRNPLSSQVFILWNTEELQIYTCCLSAFTTKCTTVSRHCKGLLTYITNTRLKIAVMYVNKQYGGFTGKSYC